MQISKNDASSNLNIVDSCGSIYCQSTHNQVLDRNFLNLNYINYSEKKEKTFTSLTNQKNSLKTNNSHLKFEYSDFIFVLQLFMLAILAYVKLNGRNYFKRLFMSVQNFSYSVSFFREKNLAFILYHNIMMLIFYMSTGIIASIIFKKLNYNIANSNQFVELFIITAVCSMFFVLNRLFSRITGFVFDFGKQTMEYLFYLGNMLKMVGIVFLFLSLLFFFISKDKQSIIIYPSILIIGIVYLVKTLRIFKIFYRNKLSLYYFILYFCALEIIPIILLIKIFNLLVYNGYIQSGSML